MKLSSWILPLLLLASLSANAQTPASVTLPDAPTPSVDAADGTVSGTVKDVSGATVPGAKIQLITPTSSDRERKANESGEFTFDAIAPGPFTLIITEQGLEPLTVTGEMNARQNVIVPEIAMKIATANESVDAITSRQLAEIEIKQEEKQRVLGIVPNFFVSYNWHAQPLDAKQKFELGLHATLDPTHFAFAAVAATIEQATNRFPGFDCQPAADGICWSALGKRYGASLLNSTSGTLLRGSVMPALFHQDPRYFYKGTGSFKSRALYAISTAVRARGDNGHWQFSSGIVAGFAAGGLSNLYYAKSDRHGVGLTFENGALNIVGVAVGHLLQEFAFKHVTPGLIHAQVKDEPAQ